MVVVLFWIAAPGSGTITWSRIPNEDHLTNICRENLETYDTIGMQRASFQRNAYKASIGEI